MNRLTRLALVSLLCLVLFCLAAAAFFPPRLDLIHLTLYNACAIRAHQFHWQNHDRQPEPLNYNFTGSPVSVVFVAIWVANGPTLNFSQALPLPCG